MGNQSWAKWNVLYYGVLFYCCIYKASKNAGCQDLVRVILILYVYEMPIKQKLFFFILQLTFHQGKTGMDT